MRSAARLMDVSYSTVAKLLVDAGEAFAEYHDEHLRNLNSKRIECDEIWSKRLFEGEECPGRQGGAAGGLGHLDPAGSGPRPLAHR